MNLAGLESKREELEEEKEQITGVIADLSSKARTLSAKEVLDGANFNGEIAQVGKDLAKQQDRLARLNFGLIELDKRIEIASKDEQERELQRLIMEYKDIGDQGKKASVRFQKLSEELIQLRAQINQLAQQQQVAKQRGQVLAKELGLSFALPQGVHVSPPTRSDLEEARKALA